VALDAYHPHQSLLIIVKNLERLVAKIEVWCFLMLLVLACSVNAGNADVHEKVQNALDYNIPLNECKKPKGIERMSAVVDGSGIMNDIGEGGVTQSNIDSYTMDRLKRKEKRWLSCVEKYKQNLLKDLAELKTVHNTG